jgi:hypothetical protein
MNKQYVQRPTTSNTLTRSIAWYWWAAGAFLAIGATAVSCSCRPEPVNPPDTDVEAELPPGLTANVPNEVCGGSRRLAMNNGGSCPGMGGKPLTGEGPLAEYCIYEKPNGVEDGVWGPPGEESVDWIGDCPVQAQAKVESTSLATLSLQELWRWIFNAEVGQVSATAMTEYKGQVMVAVIDTVGQATTPVTVSDHGPLMAHIASDLANGCINRSCTRRIQTYLGLPRVLGDDTGTRFPEPFGGRYGYASDVALAVADALADWRLPAHEGEQLIISLSVGWTNNYDFPPPGTLDPTYTILERAACRGALILAASGNRSPHSCTGGLIAPAAWEQFPRPKAARCSELGETRPVEPAAGTTPPQYEPLVHAVSAVDGAEQPLINNATTTRVAAYGFRAVKDGVAGRVLGPMTGTSVSTAAVAGIAAAVWSKYGTFTADQVMHQIWNSGSSNGQIAELQLLSASARQQDAQHEQHVVSACLALGLCETHEEASIGFGVWPLQTCGRTEVMFRTVDSVATPQPDDLVCPPCYIEPLSAAVATTDASIHLQLSEDYSNSNYTQTAVRITLWDADKRREEHIYEPPETMTINGSAMSNLSLPSLNYVGDGDTYNGALASTTIPSSLTSPIKAWIEVTFKDNNTGIIFTAGNELELRIPR